MRKWVILIVIVVLGAGGGTWWWFNHRKTDTNELVLYGNIDLRQVQLAFNNSERIAEVLVQEGDRVQEGQVVARLDVSRLKPPVDQAAAQIASQQQVVDRLYNGNRPEEIAEAKEQVKAQQAVVDRLHNGSRPEEIAQAKANLESAKADAVNAQIKYDRAKNLSMVRLRDQSDVRAVSQEDLDNAKAALDVANAKVAVNQQAFDLAVIGPRKEDIAQAEAQLEQLRQARDLSVAGARHEDREQAKAQLEMYKAQLSLLQQQLLDAELKAPAESKLRTRLQNPPETSQSQKTEYMVRTRLLEPGEMSSPQKPVFTLAIINPKWVRAYVSEPALGKVHPGMAASVAVDSFPNQRFEGWVGFISPVAEFTPKSVQTNELRTSLVYEVRVFVKDPSDNLRLGMPATVYLPLKAGDSGSGGEGKR
jgi:HlyD family secretion protein